MEEIGQKWKKACISWLAAETGKKEACSFIGTGRSVCSAAQGTVPHPPATAPPWAASPSSDRLPWEGSSLQLQPVLDIFQALDKQNSYLVCSLLSTASMPAIPQYFAKCHFCACISASQGLEGFAFSLPLASLLLQDKNLSLWITQRHLVDRCGISKWLLLPAWALLS